MKKANVLKLLVLALCVTLLGAVAVFSASAEESELSVSIVAKNVSYDDVVKVMFAVDDSNAGGNEIEVLYYLEDPVTNPDAKAYLGVEYDEGYTKDDVTYPAYFTAGFPAKAIGDQVYARAHIVGSDVYSDVMRYSVVEYLYERLYLDNATGDKKALYEDLLSYGASAQKVLCPDAETRISDYVLVGIQGGTLDGRYFQGIYVAGDKLYPTGAGVTTWYANVVDVTTGEIDTTEVANAAEYTVEGFTMFTIAALGDEEPAPDPDPTPAYKPDLTDTAGRILWSESNNISDYKSAGAIDYWMGSGAPLEIVDGAPYGEASKVVHMGTQSSGNQDQLFIKTTKAAANASVYIFESDIMVDPDSACTYELIFQNSSVPSAQRLAYKLSLRVGTNGNGQIAGSNIETVSAPGVAGNWFRLRVEYADVSDTEIKITVYFNGMKVAESAAFAKTHAANDLTQVYFAASTSSVGDMYIDNTKVEKYAPPYTPNLDDLATRETYEDGDALNLFSFNQWLNSADKSVVTVDGKPYGSDSKVLLFRSDVNPGYFEVGFEQKTIPAGTKVYVYETDMMIDPTGTARVTGDLRGSSAGTTFTFVANEGGTVTLNGTAVASAGEWFRFAIESYEDESGAYKTIFYVNGKQIGSAASNSIAPATITRTRIMIQNYICDVYFDNTKVEFRAE